jgi:hypothetical protein
MDKVIQHGALGVVRAAFPVPARNVSGHLGTKYIDTRRKMPIKSIFITIG